LWNRANVLCPSLRATSEVIAQELVDAWFATPSGADPVDVVCVAAVGEIENKYAGSKCNVEPRTLTKEL
jgi:ribose 5-phosphate isomerase B